MTGMFEHAKARGATLIEPTDKAQEEYTALCRKLLSLTLIGQTNSWFTGINKNLQGRNTRDALVWAGGNPGFRDLLQKVASNGYEGLNMR
jgi:cyclohexanone monooxygenase